MSFCYERVRTLLPDYNCTTLYIRSCEEEGTVFEGDYLSCRYAHSRLSVMDTVGVGHPFAGTAVSAASQSPRDCTHISWRLRSNGAAEHSQRKAQVQRPISRLSVVADRVSTQTSLEHAVLANQEVRDGHYEASLVQQQVLAMTSPPPLAHAFGLLW